jgi:hypothetical protein
MENNSETVALAAPLRAKISALEEQMRQCEPLVIEPKHHFAHGLYAREILVPKGTLLTGKIHLAEHLNIISKGDISVMTEDGIKRIKAPATLVSQPGIKRVGYAHEDTVWTTIHACSETDIEAIEAALVVDTFAEFDARQLAAKEEKQCHLLP